MNVSQTPMSNMAMATSVKELQTINKAQMAIMKTLADSEQQMAELLQAAGIGQNVDIRI